jgi:hypothetical protein
MFLPQDRTRTALSVLDAAPGSKARDAIFALLHVT